MRALPPYTMTGLEVSTPAELVAGLLAAQTMELREDLLGQAPDVQEFAAAWDGFAENAQLFMLGKLGMSKDLDLEHRARYIARLMDDLFAEEVPQ